MNDEVGKMNEEKIRKAFSEKIKLHISLKDGSWRNGSVLEISSEFFIFNDDVNGKEPIFFLEIKDASPYMDGEDVKCF